MKKLKNMVDTLMEILELERKPVGIKFFESKDRIAKIVKEGYDRDFRGRYCQALMRAGEGEKVVLTKENITCPASTAAFGFKPLADKLRTGEVLDKMGLFKDKDAASNTMDAIPRLELGKYQGVALGPLNDVNYPVDVIVIESKVEDIMWLALASYYDEGGRLEFNSSIFQATCVDSTVVPFLTKKINTSLGCFGCREATDVNSGEALIGIPQKSFNKIIHNLELLDQQAIPRAKSKVAFQELSERMEN